MMSIRSLLLILLALVATNVSANPYCPICGWGMMVTEPDGEVFIPTYGTYTCERLQERSEEGYVPSQNCLALQMFSRRKCGCEPAPAPTRSPSTPSPTQMPTSSSAPTSSPSASMSPTSSVSPTANPSAAPSVAPTTSIAPTDGIRHEMLEGLSLELEGIDELDSEALDEFKIVFEEFVTDYMNQNFPEVITEFETVWTLTDMYEDRRRERKLRGGDRNLAKVCVLVYSQDFIYKTTQPTIDAYTLAAAALSESIGRESLQILLEDIGDDLDIRDLRKIDEVSSVEIPSSASIIYK